jgi:tetratricopeptide (TPR) repeat protein
MQPIALSDQTYDAIQQLSSRGDALARAGNYAGAIQEYNQAWSLLPDPKNSWEAATWLLAAIGDAYFLSKDTRKAREAFESVMSCPNALGNPFLHLRLGEALYDDNELDEAADQLMRAFMGAGEEIFAAEDPKYLKFLRTRANIDDGKVE